MAQYGTKAKKKVHKAMKERKRGTLKSGKSGKKVTSRKQAIAIGLSEARRAGAKVPKKRAAKKSSAKKSSEEAGDEEALIDADLSEREAYRMPRAAACLTAKVARAKGVAAIRDRCRVKLQRCTPRAAAQLAPTITLTSGNPINLKMK